MSDLRSRLNEETTQALIMITEEFRNGKFEINDEMLTMFEKNKNELIAERIQINLKSQNSEEESANEYLLSNEDLNDFSKSPRKRKKEDEKKNSDYSLKKLKLNAENNEEEDFYLGEDLNDINDDSYQEDWEEDFSEFEENKMEQYENQE